MAAKNRTFLDVINRTCEQFKITQCADYLKMAEKQNVIQSVKLKYNVESKPCNAYLNNVIEKDWDVVFNANSNSHLQIFDSERTVKWNPIKKNAENRLVTIDLFNSQMKAKISYDDNTALLLEKFLSNIPKYFILADKCPAPASILQDIKHDYRDVNKLSAEIEQLKQYSNECYIKEGAFVREDSVINILKSFIAQIENYVEHRLIKICDINNQSFDPQNVPVLSVISTPTQSNLIDDDL